MITNYSGRMNIRTKKKHNKHKARKGAQIPRQIKKYNFVLSLFHILMAI